MRVIFWDSSPGGTRRKAERVRPRPHARKPQRQPPSAEDVRIDQAHHARPFPDGEGAAFALYHVRSPLLRKDRGAVHLDLQLALRRQNQVHPRGVAEQGEPGARLARLQILGLVEPEPARAERPRRWRLSPRIPSGVAPLLARTLPLGREEAAAVEAEVGLAGGGVADGPGPVLGAHRLQDLRQRRRIPRLAQELLDPFLRLAVGPFAEALVTQ